eukprot:CCRYP_014535-RC/>CCRYP_014535-RC protein AED:0.02 eAED:0.02 QI:419/1/1/1/0.5/0.2/5/2947/346
MTRIRKKDVPYPQIRVNSHCVVAAASLLLFVAISSLYYASRNLVMDGDASTQPEYIGDFNQVRPGYGKLSPITWQEDGSYVAPNAYRILLPSELTIAIKAFCDRIGLTDLARNFIMSQENNIEPDGYRLFDLGGITWFAQRPASTWSSDMHWVSNCYLLHVVSQLGVDCITSSLTKDVSKISPANERGHEEYLSLLRENGFLSVLNSIGHQLDLDGLAAYHLTFIVVSHCEMGFVHHDTTETGNKVFNVIIPLESVPNSPPELIISDSRDDSVGRLKYEDNIGVLIGDDVHHATSECDYRDYPGTMRLAATIYVPYINEENAETIALTTLTQAFPPPDKNWVFAQR